MSTKKTKLYDVPRLKSSLERLHPGIYKRDVSDSGVYIWYSIASAQIEADGTLQMRAAGNERTAENTYIHWNGATEVSPDHPDYPELLWAIMRCRDDIT